MYYRQLRLGIFLGAGLAKTSGWRQGWRPTPDPDCDDRETLLGLSRADRGRRVRAPPPPPGQLKRWLRAAGSGWRSNNSMQCKQMIYGRRAASCQVVLYARGPSPFPFPVSARFSFSGPERLKRFYLFHKSDSRTAGLGRLALQSLQINSKEIFIWSELEFES